MRSFCPKCHNASDFIDLDSGCCETCITELPAEVVRKSRLVSVQTAVGITKRAVVQVEVAEQRASQKGGNRA